MQSNTNSTKPKYYVTITTKSMLIWVNANAQNEDPTINKTNLKIDKSKP